MGEFSDARGARSIFIGIMNELKNDLFNIDRKFMLPYGILWCTIMILVVFDTREVI